MEEDLDALLVLVVVDLVALDGLVDYWKVDEHHISVLLDEDSETVHHGLMCLLGLRLLHHQFHEVDQRIHDK